MDVARDRPLDPSPIVTRQGSDVERDLGQGSRFVRHGVMSGAEVRPQTEDHERQDQAVHDTDQAKGIHGAVGVDRFDIALVDPAEREQREGDRPADDEHSNDRGGHVVQDRAHSSPRTLDRSPRAESNR